MNNYTEHLLTMYERHGNVVKRPKQHLWWLSALLQGFAYAAILWAILALLANVLGGIENMLDYLTLASIFVAVGAVIYG